MKYILLSLVFIWSVSYSQVIDYNNFDSRHASEVLFSKLNQFRDTITETGYGKDIESVWPALINDPQMMELTWSEKLYTTVVLPNTLENLKQKKLFHVNRSVWWDDKKNQELFLDEVYPTKNKGFRLTLTENGGVTSSKYKTYEEMADHMIQCWESSFMHRCTQRSILHNMYFYEKGYESNTIAATCVMYSEGIFYFFVDFVY